MSDSNPPEPTQNPPEPTQQPAEYIDLPENLPGDDTAPTPSSETQVTEDFDTRPPFEPTGQEHSFGIIKGLDNWLRVPLAYATSPR